MTLIKGVKYKKLGRRKALGIVEDGDDIIYIDPRLKGRKHLEILIHEAMHILWPHIVKNDEEDEVIMISVELTKMLWAEGFRRVDTDESAPYQDDPKSADPL
jgi:hypothetical protein